LNLKPAVVLTTDFTDFTLKAAVGLSTDFTDFTAGMEPEAPLLRGFHVTRGVKRQPLSTGFQSVESVKSVDPAAFSRVRSAKPAAKPSAAWTTRRIPR